MRLFAIIAATSEFDLADRHPVPVTDTVRDAHYRTSMEPMDKTRSKGAQRDRWRRCGALALSLAERARYGASYNPLSERIIQDPYPAYARLRSASPVHRSAILGSWVISRYDDVLSIARDHHRFSNHPRWRNATPSVLPPAPDDYSILLVDPPEHTRLRKVAAQVFTRPKLTALAPTIEALADEIVERAARRGHVEWIGEVAQPLAMRVMLRMLGIAENEEARWQRWSANRARLLEMIATRSERKTAHITGESITGYFRERLAERALAGGDDAISTLAGEAARGALINTAEAADMLGVIMIAGNETTANLIGNGLWALMRHPDQMERLREEPERARDAINEILRYDSPVQTDFRIAKSEAVIGGKTIRAGEGVILLTGSANRDEAAFSEPDRLDIARKGPKHAAFGHGVHQCIGAELARMETSAVIASAAARFERITLAGREPRYRRSTVVRGLERLEVRIERRHRAAHRCSVKRRRSDWPKA